MVIAEIVTPDGSVHQSEVDFEKGQSRIANKALLSRLGLAVIEGTPWVLTDLSGSDLINRRLLISRVVKAGATARDPRQERLKVESERLAKLNEESDHVRTQPIDVPLGSQPEKFQLTFLCRGIVGIDSDRRPIFAERHVAQMTCDEDFPAEPPNIQWITPIWHPNIQHGGSRNVCINKPAWLGGMGLDDLCRQLFEMVQYKNYHAEFRPPYPFDQEVARWVLEFAEPNRIIDKKNGIFADNKPFTRPTVTDRVRLAPSRTLAESRIKVLTTPASITASAPSRITLRAGGSPSLPSTNEASQRLQSRIKIRPGTQ